LNICTSNSPTFAKPQNVLLLLLGCNKHKHFWDQYVNLARSPQGNEGGKQAILEDFVFSGVDKEDFQRGAHNL